MPALGAFLLMFLASTASLGETGGRLIGDAVDENLQPLAGVLVTVSGPGAVGVYSAHTDEKGRYSVLGLPMHEPLVVRAIAEGKVPKVYVGIWVRQGGDTRRDFRLRPPDHHETLVLLDQRIPSHQLALEGARQTLPGSVVELPIKEESLEDARLVSEAVSHQPNAVMALGRTAARLARRGARQTPVVFALVPDPQGDKLLSSTVCGVALNDGLEDQLDRLSKVAPQARSLVTIFDPRRQGRSVTELGRLAKQRGMTLTARSARNIGHVERAIIDLSRDPGDAFFLLWDPEFFDEPTLGLIRGFVQTHDLIYIVPDTSLLAMGGTLTDAPGFRVMGERAGTLIGEIYRGGQPLDIGIVFPEERTVATHPEAPAPWGDLPDRIDTRIPSVLEEQLADIEKVVSLMPGMDRKKAYLITLPLETYLEDIVLPANKPIVLYPRAIAWLIGQGALLGKDKNDIARTLVTSYQRNEFPALQEMLQGKGGSTGTRRGAP